MSPFENFEGVQNCHLLGIHFFFIRSWKPNVRTFPNNLPLEISTMPSVMILFALWWSILRLQVSESWLSSPNIPMSLAGTCQKRHRGNSLPIGSQFTTLGTSCKVIPSFSHKKGTSNVGSGLEGLTPNIMTENTTAVAFGLLVDTIEKWAVVIENRQDFSKGKFIN